MARIHGEAGSPSKRALRLHVNGGRGPAPAGVRFDAEKTFSRGDKIRHRMDLDGRRNVETAMRTELTLDQMLSDTIVQLVMRRDGVTESHVRDVWDSLRRRREQSASPQLAEMADAA
jgi:hypothetical protein